MGSAPKAALLSITFTCGVSGVRLLTRAGVYHLYNCANASLQLGLRNIPGQGGHKYPHKPPAVGFHPLVAVEQSWVLEAQETKPIVKRTCPAQPPGELSEAIWVLSPMSEGELEEKGTSGRGSWPTGWWWHCCIPCPCPRTARAWQSNCVILHPPPPLVKLLKSRHQADWRAW